MIDSREIPKSNADGEYRKAAFGEEGPGRVGCDRR
jgi:hypothetical protein